MFLTLLGVCLWTQISHGEHGSAKQEPAGSFDLRVARLYESLHRWKEAELEYLQAGRIGAPGVRKEALLAIVRLKTHHPSDDDNFELELARLYHNEGASKEAEQHYSVAGKDGTRQLRDTALDGVTTARRERRIDIKLEDVDRWLGYVARCLGLLVFIVVLWGVWKIWRAIEVVAFEASSEQGRQLVSFALSSAREELPRLLGPPRPGVVDAIPLILLPGIAGDFPDPAEDLEIGGVKLPISNLIRLIKRPRVRVFGRWNVGGPTGVASARILRRRLLFSYQERSFSRFLVPSPSGAAQDQQLSDFAYDVLVKAIFSWAGR